MSVSPMPNEIFSTVIGNVEVTAKTQTERMKNDDDDDEKNESS